jgi:hypothetical protein
MQKLAAINEHLINVRNKVADLYRKRSPELFNDNKKAIKENDDFLLAAILLRGVDDETTPPYK